MNDYKDWKDNQDPNWRPESQQQGNDMRLEDSSQDEGTVTSPKGSTIEDKLNNILLTLYLGENFVTDYTRPILQKQFDNPKLAKARDQIQAIITTETTNARLEGKVELAISLATKVPNTPAGLKLLDMLNAEVAALQKENHEL